MPAAWVWHNSSIVQPDNSVVSFVLVTQIVSTLESDLVKSFMLTRLTAVVVVHGTTPTRFSNLQSPNHTEPPGGSWFSAVRGPADDMYRTGSRACGTDRNTVQVTRAMNDFKVVLVELLEPPG